MPADLADGAQHATVESGLVLCGLAGIKARVVTTYHGASTTRHGRYSEKGLVLCRLAGIKAPACVDREPPRNVCVRVHVCAGNEALLGVSFDLAGS